MVTIKFTKISNNCLRYGVIGAIAYPIIIIILTFLSLIPFVSIVTNAILGILLIPTLPFLDVFVVECSVLIPGKFIAFRVCYTGIPLLFSIIYGFIIGLIIGKIKSIRKKEHSLSA